MQHFLTRSARLGALAGVAALLTACAAPQPYDYSAFRASKPASLLVLPPLNETPEIDAVSGVLATATAPLAEAGYYVVPVSLMDETFKQNGLSTPNDIQAVAPKRLREIFGADAAVYLKVTKYGADFKVFGSDTRVTVQARIVDLRNGQQLWSGAATASSQESNNGGGGGGLLGLVVKAVVQQVMSAATDASFTYASLANQRLLAPRPNGVLPGPRLPQAQQEATR
jgi:hypothetical protein